VFTNKVEEIGDSKEVLQATESNKVQGSIMVKRRGAAFCEVETTARENETNVRTAQII
jgi:hypothetical protein